MRVLGRLGDVLKDSLNLSRSHLKSWTSCGSNVEDGDGSRKVGAREELVIFSFGRYGLEVSWKISTPSVVIGESR